MHFTPSKNYTSFYLIQAETKADMASFIVKGLVTNDGIDRLRKWHGPFTKRKSAAPILEKKACVLSVLGNLTLNESLETDLVL